MQESHGRNLIIRCVEHLHKPDYATECRDFGEEDESMSTEVVLIIVASILLFIALGLLIMWKVGCFKNVRRSEPVHA